MTLGEGRVYGEDANDLVIFTYGNGVPMSLRAARAIEGKHGWKVRVVDLRWLVPLNEALHRATQAKTRQAHPRRRRRPPQRRRGRGRDHRDRRSRFRRRPFQRVVGVDTYTPLAGAAFLVLPGDEDIVTAADRLA